MRREKVIEMVKNEVVNKMNESFKVIYNQEANTTFTENEELQINQMLDNDLCYFIYNDISTFKTKQDQVSKDIFQLLQTYKHSNDFKNVIGAVKLFYAKWVVGQMRDLFEIEKRRRQKDLLSEEINLITV